MEELHFKIINAEYSDYNHSQIRLLVEDKDKIQFPYFFTPGQEDTSEVYRYFQELYDRDELTPSINKEIDDAQKSIEIRNKRNCLLNDSDKYMIEDYPISKEDKDKVKTYRQQLRDITNQKSFPDVTWPDFPNIGK